MKIDLKESFTLFENFGIELDFLLHDKNFKENYIY